MLYITIYNIYNLHKYRIINKKNYNYILYFYNMI